MQKRKAPVFLFGLVTIAIAGMAIWNASSKPAGAEPDAPPVADDVHEKSVSEQDRAKAAEELKNAIKVDKPAEKSPTGKKAVMPDQPGTSMAMATQPTILLPKYSRYNPRPNDASTATHWYDEKSRSAKIAEENKKGGG